MKGMLSELAVPAVILLVSVLLLLPGKKVGEAFLEGARNGVRTAYSLLPTLVLFLSAVALFNASGLADAVISLLAVPAKAIGIPPEILPLLVIRPFSGAGANAYLADLFSSCGPDSTAGLCASVIAGCSDTVFYIFSVYFAAAGVKKTRYAIPAALIVSAFAVFAAAVLVRFLS